MTDNKLSSDFGESPHSVRIHREKNWPFQWIGMCACGKGTRCNSEDYAREFLADCLRPQLRGLAGASEGATDGKCGSEIGDVTR